MGSKLEDLKSVGVPLPQGQKHTAWIRTGNLSLPKSNALTTEPRLQNWHVKLRFIAIIKSLLPKKMHNQKNMLNHSLVAFQLWCCIPQSCWIYDLGSLIKCVQGFDLSSTRNSAFHHDLALLQQAINAVGVCSPQKWEHEHSGVIDSATFCCRWLGNHPFYLFYYVSRMYLWYIDNVPHINYWMYFKVVFYEDRMYWRCIE